MEAKDVRGLTDEELQEKERQLQQELFNYRFQMATGRLENPMLVRKTRRDLARVKGIRREAVLAKKTASAVKG
jgi:large subunit ribosomal protein L29